MSIEADSSVVREARPVKALPPREFLLECFEYQPETGELRWRRRPLEHFKTRSSMRMWHTRYCGKVAGTKITSGALSVGVGRYRLCLVHRIIMVMMGVPITEKDEVDHRNRKRDDNRWKNLRVCDDFQQRWNAVAPRTVHHGLPRGAYLTPSGRYQSAITHCGKLVCLGRFDTPEEAHEAYVAAETKLRGEFSITRSQQEG